MLEVTSPPGTKNKNQVWIRFGILLCIFHYFKMFSVGLPDNYVMSILATVHNQKKAMHKSFMKEKQAS